MKKKPSSELHRLQESLDKTIKEFGPLFDQELIDTDSLSSDIGSLVGTLPEPIDNLYLSLLIMEYLRWKALLIKEALKCKDFSEQLELDPEKCVIGRFLSTFTPPDETAKVILEEIRRVHHELHLESQKLAGDIRANLLDCEDVRKRLHEQLFPLFNELLELLAELSNHLEKRKE